jgi:hypothetical protein
MELDEDEISNVVPSVEAHETRSTTISEMEMSLAQYPALGDDSGRISVQLVQPTVGESAVEAAGKGLAVVRTGRNNRVDKLPVTPQSILLMRRASSCAQPIQPKSPAVFESIAKRPKKSKAKHCCKLCDQSFTRAHDLKRHNTTHERCELPIDLHFS